MDFDTNTATNHQGSGRDESGLFDLDIRLLEVGDSSAQLISLTNDGCGSTCPRACATNVG